VSAYLTMNYNSVLSIGNEKYAVEVKLYNDDEISIEMEEITSKLRYGATFTAKAILALTKDKFKLELDSKQFYTMLTKAMSNNDKHILLTFALTNDDALPDSKVISLKIKWKISEFVEKEVDIQLDSLTVSDVVRMSKMMSDLLKYKEELATTSSSLVKCKEELVTTSKQLNDFNASRNNVLNVTVFTDKVRRAYDKTRPIFTLLIDKKQADSILVVTATLCVLGEGNADSCQLWELCPTKVFPNCKTSVCGQAEGYVGGATFARNLVCSCVIEDHKHYGQQELTLKWSSEIMPFAFINPNKMDNANFATHQTCSVIRVEEIMQSSQKSFQSTTAFNANSTVGGGILLKEVRKETIKVLV